MRTREDFGPCELTERTRVALGRWCASARSGGPPDGRRLVVALGVMGNTGASDPEAISAIARRAGVCHKDARRWADEWRAIEASVREDADTELERAVLDVGVRLGQGALDRVRAEVDEAMPEYAGGREPRVRLSPVAMRLVGA